MSHTELGLRWGAVPPGTHRGASPCVETEPPPASPPARHRRRLVSPGALAARPPGDTGSCTAFRWKVTSAFGRRPQLPPTRRAGTSGRRRCLACPDPFRSPGTVPSTASGAAQLPPLPRIPAPCRWPLPSMCSEAAFADVTTASTSAWSSPGRAPCCPSARPRPRPAWPPQEQVLC